MKYSHRHNLPKILRTVSVNNLGFVPFLETIGVLRLEAGLFGISAIEGGKGVNRIESIKVGVIVFRVQSCFILVAVK